MTAVVAAAAAVMVVVIAVYRCQWWGTGLYL